MRTSRSGLRSPVGEQPLVLPCTWFPPLAYISVPTSDSSLLATFFVTAFIASRHHLCQPPLSPPALNLPLNCRLVRSRAMMRIHLLTPARCWTNFFREFSSTRLHSATLHLRKHFASGSFHISTVNIINI
jgi:hypothetical protein